MDNAVVKGGAGRAAVTADGLDGAVVAHTALSHVDGEAGHLVIAGYDVEVLAPAAAFEDVLALLWRGALPRGAAATVWARRLGEARVQAFPAMAVAVEALMRDPAARRDGMAVLRGAVAAVIAEDVPLAAIDLADGPASDLALKVTAAVAVAAAAWNRARAGLAPIAPDPALSHAADFYRMAVGVPPSGACSRALETYLVTVMDHGMNASTFTARVVASTGSDLVSAVTAAIGALKGPLHGGAPGPVLDMLDAIGAPHAAAAWIERELTQGRRIMGMGHRIYRVRDPRAAVLEAAIGALEVSGIHGGRLQMARAVEAAATGILRTRHPTRPLHANVEFYTAVLLDAVGLPRELFSLVFAAARVGGWCAHVAEQARVGRLIRPASVYVGDFGGQL